MSSSNWRRVTSTSPPSRGRKVRQPYGFTPDFGLHRARDEALFVCFVVHRLDVGTRRLLAAAECGVGMQCDELHGELARGILRQDTHGLVPVAIDHEPAFRREEEEREHVTTR